MSETPFKDLNDVFMKEYNLPMQFINPNAITNAYYNYERLEKISNFILSRVSVRPKVAIICGSGLGDIAELVENKEVLPYGDIPEFPRSTVHGHKGNFVFGNLSSLPVVCMQGRFHPFEGYSLALCTIPVKIFKLMGIKLVVVTNAAGGLNRSYNVGDLVLIKDHLSFPLLSLQHPLIGPNDERLGPRFVPITDIYNKKLRDEFKGCAKDLEIHVHEGVYGSIGGPSYETVTDSRFCLAAGLDCVGMSTTHESTVAAYCGIKVLGLSIITDKCCIEYDVVDNQDHNEIVKVAKLKAKQAEKLISTFLDRVSKNLALIE